MSSHSSGGNAEAPRFARRRFVQGLAAGGVLAAFGLAPRAGWVVDAAYA